MVTFFGLFYSFQMFPQLDRRGEGRCVDTLQHRSVLVASPVSAGNFQKFEAISGQDLDWISHEGLGRDRRNQRADRWKAGFK